MSGINWEAVQDSVKALGIIFIITISISSLILLFKICYCLRDKDFNLRRVMVFVVTCGTLLYSLFYLVMLVSSEFKTVEVTCETGALSFVYGNYYLTFVYALSIIAIALELCLTKRGKTFLQSGPARFACVTFPWIIGCIIVLPLALAGTEWTDCRMDFTLARWRTIVGISILLPAIAVSAAFVLVFKDRPYGPNIFTVSSGNNTQAVVHNNSPSGFVISQQRPDVSQLHQGPDNFSVPPPMYNGHQLHHVYHHQPQNHQSPHHHHPQPQPQYPYSVPSQYPYPPSDNHFNVSPQIPQQITPQFQSSQQQQDISGHHGASSDIDFASDVAISRNLRVETKTFAITATIFVFCSIPNAMYLITDQFNENRIKMDDVSHIVIRSLFFWLDILKWLLLNISWAVFIK